MTAFYDPTDQQGQPLNTVYAEDVLQLVDAFTGVRAVGPLQLAGQIATPTQAPTTSLSSGSLTGTYAWEFYWIDGVQDGTAAAHVNGRTVPGPGTGGVVLSSQQATVSLPNGISVPSTAIGWGLARTKAGGSTLYLVPGSEQFLTLAGTMPSSFVDNVPDSSLTTLAQTANLTGTVFPGMQKFWDSTEAGVVFPVASITTPTLPQTFKHLLVDYSPISDQTSNQFTYLSFNGDTTDANYKRQRSQFDTALTATQAADRNIACDVPPSGSQPGSYTVRVSDYTGSQKKMARAYGGFLGSGGTVVTLLGSLAWVAAGATAPVTTVTLGIPTGNLTSATRVTVYLGG